jgi:hypothetical protein
VSEAARQRRERLAEIARLKDKCLDEARHVRRELIGISSFSDAEDLSRIGRSTGAKINALGAQMQYLAQRMNDLIAEETQAIAAG